MRDPHKEWQVDEAEGVLPIPNIKPRKKYGPIIDLQLGEVIEVRLPAEDMALPQSPVDREE